MVKKKEEAKNENIEEGLTVLSLEHDVDLMAEWNEEKLNEKLNYWKEVLKLENWDIEISFARMYDLGEDVYGLNTYDTSLLVSEIKILHPIDRPPCENFATDFKRDVEFTIVHELLHLVFYDWLALAREREGTDFSVERAINSLAKALIKLAREKDEESK